MTATIAPPSPRPVEPGAAPPVEEANMRVVGAEEEES